jgi:hypothetical protein
LVTRITFLVVSTVFFQGKITGIITDAILCQVNVTIKGTKTGTATDFEGKFSINTTVT